jgi:hypothetical protein
MERFVSFILALDWSFKFAACVSNDIIREGGTRSHVVSWI